MGFYLCGLYTGQQDYKNDDGTISHSVMVATDKGSYRVFLDPKEDILCLDGLSIGVAIRLRCRPYVNKNGKLALSGGSDIRVGE